MPVAEMHVAKLPSVAITIQKEFSGINLSFLTYRNHSACPQCINLHPSHTPGLVIVFWFNCWCSSSAGWSGKPGDSSSLVGCRAVVARVDSGGALGGSAPEIQCCPLVHFHLEASVWLKSYSTREAQSSEHRGSDPRFIQHRPVSMSVER